LIAVWHSTPIDQRTKERRRPLVEQLAKQGYTQEAIAIQLGVSQQVISKDYATLLLGGNVKGQGKDTRGRKKSTGRPKSRRGEQTPITDQAREIIRQAVLEKTPVNRPELSRQHGVSDKAIQLAIAIEDTRQKTIEEKTALDPNILSKTAQEKLDIAIRAHKRKLDAEFEVRTREECRRWLNDVSLPQYAKELGELERSITSRKGIMDRITYRKILACLHPDRVLDPVLKKRYEEAFRLFTELEKRVLDEKQSPTTFRKMPRTYEDLMAMKAKVQAERRARRSASKINVR